MTLTVKDLLDDAHLGLILRTNVSEDALKRKICWSHPTELINPQLFSEDDEIIVTSGAMIPRRTRANSRHVEETSQTFIANISKAHVSALAFGTHLIHADIPRQLLAAAEDHDIPVLEVPIEVPFSWVTNAVNLAMESIKQAHLRQAFPNLRDLVAAAFDADPETSTIHSLATSIGGWCALLSPDGDVIRLSQPEAMQKAHQALNESAHPPIGEFRVHADGVRIISLSSPDGTKMGILVAESGRRDDELDDSLIVTAADLLGMILFHRRGRDAILGRARTAALSSMLSGSSSIDGPLVTALWGCTIPHEPLCVMAATREPTNRSRPTPDLLAIARSVTAPNRLVFSEGGDVLWIVIPQELSDHCADAMHDACQAIVGMSRPCTHDRLGMAHQEAFVAAELARHAVGHVVRFGGGKGPTTLGATMDADPTSMTDVIERLDAISPALRSSLLVWLLRLGNTEQAARVLGIHRHTLSSRLQTCEKALGASLSDPMTRAELLIILRTAAETSMNEPSSGTVDPLSRWKPLDHESPRRPTSDPEHPRA